MSLIHLYDPIRTAEDLALFVDYNYIDHIVVIKALELQRDIVIDLLNISRLLNESAGVFAINHQAMHTATNLALNLPSSDFTRINFNDLQEIDSMRWLHAEEHRQWHTKLTI